MTREQAIPFIGHYVDDALSDHTQPVTDRTRLVGWQCGSEPMFVAVNSYLPECTVDDEEAAKLATDLLEEIEWFSNNEPSATATEPDYIL